MKPCSVQSILTQVLRPISLAVCLASATEIQSQTPLLSGHTDVGIGFEDGEWDLHVGRHEDNPPAEFTADEVVLQVAPAGRTIRPAGAGFEFLGEPGTPVYLLPGVETSGLLFLGLSAEELPVGVFTSDQVGLELKAVAGPGHFFLYEVSALGVPTVFMNSRDGITSADRVSLTAGSHRHANWAFTAPGVYELVFEASGTLVTNGQRSASGPVTYTFKVLGDSPRLSLAQSPEGFVLQWPSLPGVIYVVHHRSGLGDGWKEQGDRVPGTGALLSVTLPNDASSGFFRVLLE